MLGSIAPGGGVPLTGAMGKVPPFEDALEADLPLVSIFYFNQKNPTVTIFVSLYLDFVPLIEVNLSLILIC